MLEGFQHISSLIYIVSQSWRILMQKAHEYLVLNSIIWEAETPIHYPLYLSTL